MPVLQGLDIPLLMSVPSDVLQRRVELVEFEAIGRSCDPIYIGQPSCDVASAYLQSIGFRPKMGPRGDACAGMTANPYTAGRSSQFGWGCEATMRFENRPLMNATASKSHMHAAARTPRGRHRV